MEALWPCTSLLNSQSLLQVQKLLTLAAAVLLTFAVCWAPWLLSQEAALGVLQRVLPVKRGLYEDYVGNFWCATNFVVKWRKLYEQQVRTGASSGCTGVRQRSEALISAHGTKTYKLRARKVSHMGMERLRAPHSRCMAVKPARFDGWLPAPFALVLSWYAHTP